MILRLMSLCFGYTHRFLSPLFLCPVCSSTSLCLMCSYMSLCLVCSYMSLCLVCSRMFLCPMCSGMSVRPPLFWLVVVHSAGARGRAGVPGQLT